MRVLITGGAGFIGAHLAAALVERGDEVAVGDVLRDFRPELIYHLPATRGAPAEEARVIVGGTAGLLAAARASGRPRVVLGSSAAVYGEATFVPTWEDCPIAPLSPSGCAHAAAELYARQSPLPTLAVRLANVYGPGHGLVSQLTAGTIHGDGYQTRDLIHVADVVEALLAAGETDLTGAVNVGTGRETSVRALAARLGVECRYAPAREFDRRRSCLAIDRARLDLGWTPRTSLEEGLALRAG